MSHSDLHPFGRWEAVPSWESLSAVRLGKALFSKQLQINVNYLRKPKLDSNDSASKALFHKYITWLPFSHKKTSAQAHTCAPTHVGYS